ncbi:Histone-lysine N-methyltransferase SETMAR, partial [Camponotus floridanus]
FHDNARLHVSLTTRQKLMQFNQDILSHPSHSLDFASPDYHLSPSLQNSFNGKNFISSEVCKNHLKQFF